MVGTGKEKSCKALMKYGLTITVPNNDERFILSGLRVANMWTWGHARKFKSAGEARAFGEKNYGEHWQPQAVPLMIAQRLVRDVVELYSGKKMVTQVQIGISHASYKKIVDAPDRKLKPDIARIQEIMRNGDLPKQHRVH